MELIVLTLTYKGREEKNMQLFLYIAPSVYLIPAGKGKTAGVISLLRGNIAICPVIYGNALISEV